MHTVAADFRLVKIQEREVYVQFLPEDEAQEIGVIAGMAYDEQKDRSEGEKRRFDFRVQIYLLTSEGHDELVKAGDSVTQEQMRKLSHFILRMSYIYDLMDSEHSLEEMRQLVRGMIMMSHGLTQGVMFRYLSGTSLGRKVVLPMEITHDAFKRLELTVTEDEPTNDKDDQDGASL